MSEFGGALFSLVGDGRALYPKETDRRPQAARVLITVKATPQPSQKYGDTVCVAGIRLREDTGPEWIRLYPVPFRSMDVLDRFRKYELLDLQVTPSRDDPRAESYKPDRSSIQHGERLEGWKARHPFVEPLADRWTMCGVLRAARAREPYPTLAVIRPQEVTGLEITNHPGWTADQLARMSGELRQQMDLFDQEATPTVPLEAPRFVVKYAYRCADAACNGHKQSLIDWEVTELVRRHHQGDDDATAAEAVRSRFLDQMASPERGPLFFVGNQLKNPLTYSVLGVYRSVP